jgi:hypothetical protein
VRAERAAALGLHAERDIDAIIATFFEDDLPKLLVTQK